MSREVMENVKISRYLFNQDTEKESWSRNNRY